MFVSVVCKNQTMTVLRVFNNSSLSAIVSFSVGEMSLSSGLYVIRM